jgi:molecular chaperone IbpA
MLFEGHGYAPAISLRYSVRLLVSTTFLTSWKRPSGPARTTNPPYNIERLSDDSYQISLAVAGFSPDDIAVTAEQNVVTIEGSKYNTEHEYLYRGISARPFKRQFSLADYVQVKRATYENGLLKIKLFREIPEAMKPRRIAINAASADNVQQLGAKAA